MKKTTKYHVITVISFITIICMLIIYWNIQPYYKKYSYIAHALGGIDNQDYTNSKEALEYSYSMGYRVMEVDLLFTSDRHLVCRHNWNDKFEDGFSEDNIPDYKTFMNSKIYGKYTPIDIETIIRFAMKHPDVSFITDSKLGDFDISKIAEEIISASKKLGYKDYNKQIIIQFYNYDDYKKLTREYDFQNYIFTLYKMQGELKENGVDNIIAFCIENNIKVVTLPEKYVTEERSVSFRENDITLLTHTVDNRKAWNNFMKMGVDGIYTNYITPVKIYSSYSIRLLLVLNSFALLVCMIKVINYRKKSFSHTLIEWSVDIWD